jgi:hypothetical protein
VVVAAGCCGCGVTAKDQRYKVLITQHTNPPRKKRARERKQHGGLSNAKCESSHFAPFLVSLLALTLAHSL